MSLSYILSYMWYNLQTWVRSMYFRGSCSVSPLPPLGFAEQESCVPLAQIMLWVTKTLEAPATWSEPALKAHKPLSCACLLSWPEGKPNDAVC